MQFPVRELKKKEFPLLLKEIPEPPEKLYLRGELPPAGTKYLAVVGSRAITKYGRHAIDTLISGLAGYPISIVSGLALGVDGAAHEAALAAGLHTLVIPGSGIEDHVMHPRTNRPLAARVLEAGGGLMTEFPPNSHANLWAFPRRNRIMAGMSDATLIIEAGERSGTLITARLAGEYNRDLLCVPHEIGSPHGFGAHLFLRLGATLVSTPEHILEALHIPIPDEKKKPKKVPKLEGAEKKLYDLLATATPRDELIRASKLGAGDALTALVSLELQGLAKEDLGEWRRV